MITEIPKIDLILFFSVPLAVFGLRRSFVGSLRKRMHALNAGLFSGECLVLKRASHCFGIDFENSGNLICVDGWCYGKAFVVFVIMFCICFGCAVAGGFVRFVRAG